MRWHIRVDVHQIVADTIELLNPANDRHITISRKLEAAGGFMQGDPDQLQTVLFNIAMNGAEAMPYGGSLTFRTESVRLHQYFCDLHPGATPGPNILVSISDTGTGIPDDIRDCIFEPFFTTKSEAHSTGMGLAMAYGVVSDHGGAIEFESTPGRGTTFTMYLPSLEAEQPAEAGTPAEKPPPGKWNILIVDDDEIVARLTKRVLEGLGYSVITASDGQQAVELYRQRRSEIDLVIVDLSMPGLSGGDCYLSLRKIDPDVKALLSTGYEIDGTAQTILEDGVLGIVQKPFRVNDLAEAVAHALNR